MMCGTDGSTLRSSVLELARAIVNRTAVGRGNGEIQNRTTADTKLVCVSLTGEAGRQGATYEPREVTKTEWPNGEAQYFYQNVVRILPEYRGCLQAIEHVYGSDRHSHRENSLDIFAWNLTRATSATDEFVADSVERLMRDMDDCMNDYPVAMWLDGLSLQSDRLEVGALLVFRKPTVADVNECLENLLCHWADIQLPTAILTGIVRASSINEVQSWLERVVGVLRLYRLCTAQCPRAAFPLYPFGMGVYGGTMRMRGGPCIYRCSVGQNDAALLYRLMGRLMPLVPDPYRDTEVTPISVASDRFAEVLTATAAEARITSAISCLEALLSEENSELSHRLSQRVAMLLKVAGHDAKETYGNVHAAYKVRSRFTHGMVVKKHEAVNAQTLCEKAADYCRLSLLILIQLYRGHRKRDILNLLDASMLDPPAFDELRGIIDCEVVITR
jgi:hypothetical protein